MSNWFEIDRAGLAAILERRGKAFAVLELISNAWDSGTDWVEITLTPVAGQPYANLVVEDWGEGFADLTHAFTMFAKSKKADQPNLRGRFNLGEKLVLACCRHAQICTTSGTLIFAGNERRALGSHRERGTKVDVEIRMTRDEMWEVEGVVSRVIPPVRTMFNDKLIQPPERLTECVAKLPTEIADSETGLLRRSMRETAVEIHASLDWGGELYELGIPVVALDMPYRVNVLQKVPLNLERDNVTPAFLRTLQAAVLNAVHQRLTPEMATQPWVQEAAGDIRVSPEALKSVLTQRFGERAVVATPGDPVANSTAESAGFTVVPGGALSGDIWANVKKANLLLPSSQVFPTPKPEQIAARAAEVCPTCGKPR